MATCKDCLHYDACEECFGEFRCNFPPNPEWSDSCSFFTNKSEWVHLPCKVGDTVWLVFTPKYPANPNDKGKWFMIKDGVQRIIYGAKGLSIETWNVGTISAKEIGKKLFFNCEEAEKALSERRKDNADQQRPTD